MAACASEHVELIMTLVEELGADPCIRNGEMMMAADYCRVVGAGAEGVSASFLLAHQTVDD